MTKSRLFIAGIAISTTLATPAFAQWQWQLQEPAAYASMYPNGDRNVSIRRRGRRWPSSPRRNHRAQW